MHNPHNAEYYREQAAKGIRTNYFYIIDLEKNKLSDVCADDNGTYIKCRNTLKTYFVADKHVYIAHKNDKNEFYYYVKESNPSYQKVFVDSKDVVTLNRKCAQAKSFPLKLVIVTISSSGKTSMHPYAAVMYIVSSVIKESSTIKPHGNCTKNTAKQ